MNELTAQMIEYYRQRAPSYDESMGYTDADRWERHADLVRFLREQLAARDILEVACGPGHWTQAVSAAVHSIVATDINEAVLIQARGKRYPRGRVSFSRADAYSLGDIPGVFTGGLAVDWWSHMPKARVREFIASFHARLAVGARVVFIDQLPRAAFDRMFRRYDDDGNLIQTRWLTSGQSFEVIKNFPTREQLFSVLQDSAVDADYFVHVPTQRWVLAYSRA